MSFSEIAFSPKNKFSIVFFSYKEDKIFNQTFWAKILCGNEVKSYQFLYRTFKQGELHFKSSVNCFILHDITFFFFA